MAAFTDTLAHEYANAFRAVGYKSVLYGLASTVKRFGSYYDGVIVAGGLYYRTGANPAPSDPRDAAMSVPTNWYQGWQWWGTHDFNGIGVDESVVDDWFTEETGLTAAERGDLASAQVYQMYAGVLRQNADDDTNGRDYWYNNILQNGFGSAIKSFLASPAAVAALKAQPMVDISGLQADIASIKSGLASASK